jgi:hypothetical protein
MPDLFDTSAIRDEAEYWDALATRVAAHTSRRARELEWLAGARAGWVAASLLLAASLALFLLPRGLAGVGITGGLELTFSPQDSVGRVLASRDAPPSIAALFLADPLSGSGR